MSKVLRVFMLDGNASRALRIAEALKNAGSDLKWERIEEPREFLDHLSVLVRRFPWEVILSDPRLPKMDGLQGLQLLRQSWHNVSFIFVTPSLSNEEVAECFRQGADDWVHEDHVEQLKERILRALDRYTRPSPRLAMNGSYDISSRA